MTSNRVTGLAIVTLSMFAFSIFMKDGVFLYPFGLFKAVLFLVFPVMLIVDKVKPELKDWLLLFAMSCLFFGSNFALQIVYPEISDDHTADRIVLIQSLSLVFASVCFLVNAVLFAKDYNDRPSIFFGIGFLGLATAILSNHLEWGIGTLPCWFLAAYLKGKLEERFRSFSLLLGLLILTIALSAFYFGKDQVLLSV
jgi:hypothetical protein